MRMPENIDKNRDDFGRDNVSRLMSELSKETNLHGLHTLAICINPDTKKMLADCGGKLNILVEGVMLVINDHLYYHSREAKNDIIALLEENLLSLKRNVRVKAGGVWDRDSHNARVTAAVEAEDLLLTMTDKVLEIINTEEPER